MAVSVELFRHCRHLVYWSQNTLIDCLAGVNTDPCFLWCLFDDLIGALRGGFLHFLHDTSNGMSVKGFFFFYAFGYGDSMDRHLYLGDIGLRSSQDTVVVCFFV